MPKISICLPNLNSRPFIEERIDSIRSQTFGDFEVIVVDGHSTDGSWEFLCEVADRDARFECVQTPPTGVYPAINFALAKSKGDFIYIATSDDTMRPDCLSQLLGLFQQFPQATIAQCNLELIHEDGSPFSSKQQWLTFAYPRYLNEFTGCVHFRPHGYDMLAHCAFGMIYSSLTQVLVRRQAVNQVGNFPTEHGSHGDFLWGMMISSTGGTAYTPRKLATWRRHAGQLSQQMAENLRFEITFKMLLEASKMLSLDNVKLIRSAGLACHDSPLAAKWVGYCWGSRQRVSALLRFPHLTFKFFLHQIRVKLDLKKSNFSPADPSKVLSEATKLLNLQIQT